MNALLTVGVIVAVGAVVGLVLSAFNFSSPYMSRKQQLKDLEAFRQRRATTPGS